MICLLEALASSCSTILSIQPELGSAGFDPQRSSLLVQPVGVSSSSSVSLLLSWPSSTIHPSSLFLLSFWLSKYLITFFLSYSILFINSLSLAFPVFEDDIFLSLSQISPWMWFHPSRLDPLPTSLSGGLATSSLPQTSPWTWFPLGWNRIQLILLQQDLSQLLLTYTP